MKQFTFLLIMPALAFLLSCGSSNQNIDAETYAEYQSKGTEVAQMAQRILLENVARAMQTGGPAYAVEFCNLEASGIIDSVNHINDCVVSRVTTKTRNPKNRLSGKTEEAIWKSFREGSLQDTLLVSGAGKLRYYKPIRIGMPACLKCHGKPANEIDEATLDKIKQLYPQDMATGYQLNDLRGLWKIEFATK